MPHNFKASVAKQTELFPLQPASFKEINPNRTSFTSITIIYVVDNLPLKQFNCCFTHFLYFMNAKNIRFIACFVDLHFSEFFANVKNSATIPRFFRTHPPKRKLVPKLLMKIWVVACWGCIILSGVRNSFMCFNFTWTIGRECTSIKTAINQAWFICLEHELDSYSFLDWLPLL